jgi:hypothetical protein
MRARRNATKVGAEVAHRLAPTGRAEVVAELPMLLQRADAAEEPARVQLRKPAYPLARERLLRLHVAA